AFLEHDVRSAAEQRRGHTRRNFRKTADRTRRHQHAERAIAATGDCSADVGVLIVLGGERAEFGVFHLALMAERENRGLADDEMRFDAELAQLFERLDAIDDAGSAA